MQLPNIELSELRYFYCAATAGSFAEGARRVHVTAPAISKAMKKLEETLGVELFDRSARQIALTNAGQVLLGHARGILESVQTLSSAIDEVGQELRGELRIGASEHFSAEALPLALAQMARAHPRLIVHTYLMGPEQIAGCLEHGDLDVGLVAGRVPTPYETATLLRSPNSIVCGRGHALYEGQAKQATDQTTPQAAQFPFVVPRFFGEATHDRRPGSAPKRTIGATVELVQMAIRMVEHGSFLGHFPDVMIRCQLRHGELRRVQGATADAATELVAWRRPGSAGRRASDTLLDELAGTLEETLDTECPV